MNKVIPLLMFLIVLNFQADYCTADSKSIDNNPLVANLLNDLQRGEWLNKAYIEKLKTTRSPQKAVEDIVEDFFTIKKDQSGYSIDVIYNFHEGGEPFQITGIKEIASSKGVYEFAVKAAPFINEKNNRLMLFKKKGLEEIQWSYERDHKKIKNTFIRVEPSITIFVNRILFAGKYKDKQGKSFIFTEDGMAKWPQKNFRYEILLDYVGSPPSCDLLKEVDKKGNYSNPAVLYRFEWKDETLLIYKVDNTGDRPICDRQPIHKLRRIK